MNDGDSHTLEDALDGVLVAAEYSEDVGLTECAEELNALYQKLGREAPESEWSELHGTE